ncbi:MAG: TraR/DksA C4-type zinc finger protein [Ferruginibacter sp.]
MATKKPAAKQTVKKPASKKAVAKPVKKAAPVNKQAKPAPKKIVAKPVKKVAISKKPAAKPVAKKSAKPVAKPLAKKIPAKVKPVAKPVARTLPSKNAKPSVTPASKKPVAVQKPIKTPMATKIKEIKPVAKAPAKPALVPKAIIKNAKVIKVVPSKPVIIPKINHKSARKYQPDFTKSVLDQLKNDPGAPIVRYNDNDLAEFRELIQRKLGAAKKELTYLQGLITRKDDMGGDESDNRYMTMEDGSLSMEREQLSQMASRQITFIDHLEKALMRIENKTYGICRVTGKLIDKARLRAVPHATLSIEAKMGIAK